MPRPLSFLFLFLLMVVSAASAQVTLQGNINHAQIQAPIEAAHVFLTNTTKGALSGANGTYQIKNIPPGQYQLIISHLGYETAIQDLHIKGTGTYLLDIVLQPQAIEMAEVEVTSSSQKKWKRDLKKFTQAFLGYTPNASKCRLLNPEVVHLRQEGAVLHASAQELLQIENQATGYRVYFLLEHFRLAGTGVSYSGKTLFEALSPSDRKAQKQWAKKRTETYRGSSRHFLQSLFYDQLASEGFTVFAAEQIGPRQFSPQQKLRASEIVFPSESPMVKVLRFADALKVVYTKEQDQVSYKYGGQVSGSGLQIGRPAEREMMLQSESPGKKRSMHQESFFQMRAAQVLISEEGYARQADLLVEYGYWNWEGVADLLPLEYSLLEKTPKEPAPQLNGFRLSQLLVPLKEIKQGGPPKDGIPAIDQPQFVSVQEASFLQAHDRVLGISIKGVSKAYPIRILDRHEVVNDLLADLPVAITYCPLCRSGMAFLARLKGERKTFGVSGLLYNSDVLLYDRETESLWSQIHHQAISGDASGTSLSLLPLQQTTWQDWQSQHPNTLVLSTNTGHTRSYEDSPYQNYEATQNLAFPVQSQDQRFPNKSLVIGLEINGQYKAYHFSALKKLKTPLKDRFQNIELRIHYNRKENSAHITDAYGKVLPGVTLYWFAWYAFHPETEVYAD